MRTPELKQRARELRRAQTDAEHALWYRLRRRQVSGHRFRRQRRIGRYVADFACLEARLVVEVDGNGHAESVRRDQARDRSLARAGYRVLRFSNREVLTEIDGVLERIAEAIFEYWNPKAEG